MLQAIFFIFGLIIGSFLNAVIYRLYAGKSIADGRSQCPHCGHDLTVFDLVPVFSFLWLRGRCRYCHKPISWQYPVVELITAVSFALLSNNYGLRITDYEFWFSLIFNAFFIIIAVFDLKHYLILDKIVFPAAGVALFQLIYETISQRVNPFTLSSPLIQGLLGVIIIAGFFGLQYLVSKGRWIGLGDVKLGIFLGLVFGVGKSLMLLMLAYFSGAMVGVLLILLGKRQLSGKMPFGTFLAFSGIMMVLYGQSLIHWYLGLLGF